MLIINIKLYVSSMFLLGLFLLAVSSSVLSYPNNDLKLYSIKNSRELFNDFIVNYNRTYNNEIEKEKRYNIFLETLNKVNKLNLLSGKQVHGINLFADRTEEELEHRFGCYFPKNYTASCRDAMGDEFSNSAPDSFDWRDQNKVTPVKNQYNCGSCWAFSTTGNLEGAYAIKNNDLQEFSEQQLVDCDKSSAGCNGGWMSSAMTYYIGAGGAMLESDYKYTSLDGKCKFDANKVKAKVTSCNSYNKVDEEKLKDILNTVGPLSIGLDASSLRYYRKGILTDCSAKQANHAVLLVGYGTEQGTDYWIIKNSWSFSWGESGYARLVRGKNACGFLNNEIVSVVV